MALTEIPIELSSTPSIVDNGNATAITIDSSENVGIGRTSITQPSSGATTLAIQGTDTTKGGAIQLYSSDDSVAAYIYPDNSNGLSINTSTSHPIVFRTAGTERIRINSSGGLDITNGSVGISGDNYVYSYSGGSSGQVRSGIKLEGSTNTLEFYTGQNERMRIDSSGQVGIGNISPAQTLEIHNSVAGDYTDFGLRGTGHKYVIGVGNDAVATVNDKWYLYDNDNSAFRMVVDTAGNVGIGTENPGAKLDLRGDMRLDGSAGTDRSLYFRNQGTVGGQVKSDKNLSLWAGNGSGTATQYLTIKEGGNVGIGTSSPAQLLHIKSSAPDIRIEDSDGGYIDLNGPAGSLELRADQGNSVGSSTISFWVDAAERMRIDANGNVGIGCGPDKKLSINTGAAADGIRYEVTYAPVNSLPRGTVTWDDGNASGNVTGQIDTRYDGSDVSMHFGSLYSGGYNALSRLVIKGNGLVTQNSVGRKTVGGSVAGNGTLSFVVNHQNQSTFHIRCGFNHYGFLSYGCAYETVAANGSGGLTTIGTTVNHTTSLGGAWSLVRNSATQFVINKSAGSYAGGGFYYIIVEGNAIS